MFINDLKRIFKDWDSIWQMILSYHHPSLEAMPSQTIKSFLSELSIQDVFHYKTYDEYPYNDEIHFSSYEEHRIDISTKEKSYTILYEFFYDNYDIYEPDLFIIEQNDKREIKCEPHDFFEQQDSESIHLFYKCINRLLKEIDIEYTSELRSWEIEQNHKVQKRFSKKNRIRKKFK